MVTIFMLLFLILGSGAVFTAIPGSPLNMAVRGRAVKALPARKQRSWAATQLIKENAELPVENQVDGLESVVDALDVKFEVDFVNSHFTDDYNRPNWEHHEYGRCTLAQYTKIHEGIADIKNALHLQKHTLAVAAVQHDLNRVDDVIEQLEHEKSLVTDTTKMLTTGY